VRESERVGGGKRGFAGVRARGNTLKPDRLTVIKIKYTGKKMISKQKKIP